MGKIPGPKIIHIPQFHPAAPGQEDRLSASDRDDILRSQYAIAQFFWDKPDAVVFVEGLMEELVDENRDKLLKDTPDLEYIRKSFENGLPISVDALTPEQKGIFTTFMAVPVLWVLGRLKNAHSTGKRADQTKLVQRASWILRKGHDRRIFRYFAFTKRESLAFKQVRKFLKEKRDSSIKEVYLVFGAAHVFHQCDQRLELDRAA